MGSTGEATDQDMLAPDLLPHPPQTSRARYDGDLHAVGWGEGA